MNVNKKLPGNREISIDKVDTTRVLLLVSEEQGYQYACINQLNFLWHSETIRVYQGGVNAKVFWRNFLYVVEQIFSNSNSSLVTNIKSHAVKIFMSTVNMDMDCGRRFHKHSKFCKTAHPRSLQMWANFAANHAITSWVLQFAPNDIQIAYAKFAKNSAVKNHLGGTWVDCLALKKVVCWHILAIPVCKITCT